VWLRFSQINQNLSSSKNSKETLKIVYQQYKNVVNGKNYFHWAIGRTNPSNIVKNSKQKLKNTHD